MMTFLPPDLSKIPVDPLADASTTLNDPWNVIIETINEFATWILSKLGFMFHENKNFEVAKEPEVIIKDFRTARIPLNDKLEIYGLIEMNRALTALIQNNKLPEKLQLTIKEGEVIQSESVQLKNNSVQITERGVFQLFEQKFNEEGEEELVDLGKDIVMRRFYNLSPRGRVANYHVELSLDHSKELYQQFEMLDTTPRNLEKTHEFSTFLRENGLPENVELFSVDKEESAPLRGIIGIWGRKADVYTLNQFELSLPMRDPEHPEIKEQFALGKKVEVEQRFVLSTKGHISALQTKIKFV